MFLVQAELRYEDLLIKLGPLKSRDLKKANSFVECSPFNHGRQYRYILQWKDFRFIAIEYSFPISEVSKGFKLWENSSNPNIQRMGVSLDECCSYYTILTLTT